MQREKLADKRKQKSVAVSRSSMSNALMRMEAKCDASNFETPNKIGFN